MSGVQQKSDPQASSETSLDQLDLIAGNTAVQFQTSLDLEDVPLVNQELEEVIRLERQRAQEAQPVTHRTETPLVVEETRQPDIIRTQPSSAPTPAPNPTLLSGEHKLSALEREAEKIRAAASLEQQVERVPLKKLPVALEQSEDTEPVIHRRRAQPAINIQVKPEPVTAPPREAEPAAVHRPQIIRNVRIQQPAPEKIAEPQMQERRPPSAPETTRETAAERSPAPRTDAAAPVSAADLKNSPATAISRERPVQQELDLQMEPEQELGMTLEQALKLDLSRAQIGTGAAPKQLSFRGHSIGSGTVLDRLITAIADFIKRLEMRFFSFLTRKRLERKTIKIKLAQEQEQEEDGLHLASFSRTLSKERRRRRRLVARFRK